MDAGNEHNVRDDGEWISIHRMIPGYCRLAIGKSYDAFGVRVT